MEENRNILAVNSNRGSTNDWGQGVPVNTVRLNKVYVIKCEEYTSVRV